MKLQPFAKDTINFKFGVGDYVREVASPAKFVSDPMSGRDVPWGGATYTGPVTFYSSTELQPIPVNQCSRTLAQKTQSGVRHKNCVVGKFWGVLP